MPWPHSKTEKPAPFAAGSGGGTGAAGSRVWTVKSRLEFGKNTPRINWLTVPVGGYAAARAALAGAGGQMILLFVASAAGKSALPAGRPLVLSTCATRSAPCSGVNCAAAAAL